MKRHWIINFFKAALLLAFAVLVSTVLYLMSPGGDWSRLMILLTVPPVAAGVALVANGVLAALTENRRAWLVLFAGQLTLYVVVASMVFLT